MLGVAFCEYVDKLYNAQNRYIVLPSCEYDIILCSFVLAQ